MKHKFALTLAASISSLFVSSHVTDSQSAPVMTVQDNQDDLDAKVRKLLKVTGAFEMGEQVMGNMLDNFQKLPNLPYGFLEKFKELAKPSDLLEVTVRIYKKHLDAKTVDAAIAFFTTPAGKKFTSMQPAIMQESMEAGEKWGRDLAMKVMAELNK